MSAKKKKDAKMGSFGKKGAAGLLERLGTAEKITAHFKKLARKRWNKHPEQRSIASRAKASKR